MVVIQNPLNHPFVPCLPDPPILEKASDTDVRHESLRAGRAAEQAVELQKAFLRRGRFSPNYEERTSFFE